MFLLPDRMGLGEELVPSSPVRTPGGELSPQQPAGASLPQHLETQRQFKASGGGHITFDATCV